MRCEERVRRRRSHGTPSELGAQKISASSTCASRQSNRTLWRMKEQQARERTREQRLVMSLLERQLNPKDGNVSGQTVTFSTLQSWRQRGRVSTESTENEDTQEKSQEFRKNSRFTGIVIGSEKEKKKNDKKLSRVESDGILLIVPVQINGKVFSALIDSGATRCFVTQKCCTIAG